MRAKRIEKIAKDTARRDSHRFTMLGSKIAMPKGTVSLTVWLLCIVVLVVLEGYVANSAPRQFVQLLPVVLTIGLVLRFPPIAAYMAMGVFVFWVLNMDFIWSSFLGLTYFPEQTFTTIEFMSMVLIAPIGVLGFTSCIRIAGSMSLHNRVALVLVGLGVQYVFMMLSFLPIFHR